MKNQIKAMQLIANKKHTKHLLHLVLSVITAGLWVPIWVLVSVSNSIENRRIDRAVNKLS